MFDRIIDARSQCELHCCAEARYRSGGWEFPGQQGLVGSPCCLLAATLLRIAGNEPPIGTFFAQRAAERLRRGEDAQRIARDLLALVAS